MSPNVNLRCLLLPLQQRQQTDPDQRHAPRFRNAPGVDDQLVDENISIDVHPLIHRILREDDLICGVRPTHAQRNIADTRHIKWPSIEQILDGDGRRKPIAPGLVNPGQLDADPLLIFGSGIVVVNDHINPTRERNHAISNVMSLEDDRIPLKHPVLIQVARIPHQLGAWQGGLSPRAYAST